MINISACNVTLMVSDLDKSTRFYADVLGFKIIQRYGNHYAQISAPGIVIGLHPARTAIRTNENISLGFSITDFEQAIPALNAFSISYVERNEQGGNFIHFNDPDGYPLYFIKPKQ